MAEDLRFRKRSVFINPSDAFTFKLQSIEDIKNECLFVVDTNILLLPFTTGVKSLTAIKSVYENLVANDRLFLPAQVVREFLDNRAQKLSEMKESLQKKLNQSYQYVGAHPLLSELPEFKALEEQEVNLKEQISKYNEEIKKTIGVIQSWGWDDPVSQMYHEVLSDRVLDDSFIKNEEIAKDLERRNTLSIPPGYKDKEKEENQAGDLLIWHEILNLAEKKGSHLVFVTGDEKQDWWHQSGRKALYPRFELVDEYRERSKGKSFHMVSLSSLLKLFDAEEEVIEAVKSSESTLTFATKHSQLSNVELRDRALDIVNELREKISQERMLSDQLSSKRMEAVRTASSEEEKSLMWNKFNELDREPTRSLMNFYNSNHKIDAILIRSELERRLPRALLDNRSGHVEHIYEHPTNPLGLTDVADDLEILAKSLV
ncbi:MULTISPECIES: PIN domain-containing protein [Idiomarina]|uniref:PIN domain-containing protein n=1 Tax=Idiomarina TaxID=135575 RepID=UPI000C5D0C78|nr:MULTISPECIES: PIN domain-containing protein [Idiomarina]MBP59434.1 HNH endonuclease [Idiomarina sp.]